MYHRQVFISAVKCWKYSLVRLVLPESRTLNIYSCFLRPVTLFVFPQLLDSMESVTFPPRNVLETFTLSSDLLEPLCILSMFHWVTVPELSSFFCNGFKVSPPPALSNCKHALIFSKEMFCLYCSILFLYLLTLSALAIILSFSSSITPVTQ